MKLVNKKHLYTAVIASTLVLPLHSLTTTVEATTTIESKAKSSIRDGIYDVSIITYKDQTNEKSISANYFKEPTTLTVKNGKNIITTTLNDSDYFAYLKTEDIHTPGVFHDVKVLSEQKDKAGKKVIQLVM